MLKLGLLALTIGIALPARLWLIPRLSGVTLPFLALHIAGVTGLALALLVAGVSLRQGGL